MRTPISRLYPLDASLAPSLELQSTLLVTGALQYGELECSRLTRYDVLLNEWSAGNLWSVYGLIYPQSL